jgi:DNA polymerase III alpha subunit
MNYDKLGIAYSTTDELCDLLYANPTVDISKVFVEDPEKYNTAVKEFFAELPYLQLYNLSTLEIEKFDQDNQANWLMPVEYQNFDIAQWVLDQCTNQEELQRCGQELLMFEDRNLFNLLRWLKYFVDTLRANNIVWGVGRGSSVASYVLYIIGVHRINSLYYDLNIEEFLK